MRVKIEITEETKTLYGQGRIAESVITVGHPFVLEKTVGTVMIGDAMIVQIVTIAAPKITETEMTDAAGRAEIDMFVGSDHARARAHAHALVTDAEVINLATTVERGGIRIVTGSVQSAHWRETQAHLSNGSKLK